MPVTTAQPVAIMDFEGFKNRFCVQKSFSNMVSVDRNGGFCQRKLMFVPKCSLKWHTEVNVYRYVVSAYRN